MKESVTILIGILALITLLLFFNCKRRSVSYFSGSNTFFAMNELDWIPTEIKNLLRDRINDDVVPAVKRVVQRDWDNMPATDRDDIIRKGNAFFDNLVAAIEGTSLSVTTM